MILVVPGNYKGHQKTNRYDFEKNVIKPPNYIKLRHRIVDG